MQAAIPPAERIGAGRDHDYPDSSRNGTDAAAHFHMTTAHVKVMAIVGAETVARVEAARRKNWARGLLVTRLNGVGEGIGPRDRRGRARIEVLTSDERANGVVAVLLESAAVGAGGGDATVRVIRPGAGSSHEVASRR